jgi:hydrogenase nickel incorporation protein HypA/HybF
MHEVALAASLVDLVVEEATAAGAREVKRITLEIGALSHVAPQALRFAFDAATAGTPAAGAALDIVEPPGQAWCMDCSKTVEIAKRGDPCPVCAGSMLLVQGGEEMRLRDMEVV